MSRVALADLAFGNETLEISWSESPGHVAWAVDAAQIAGMEQQVEALGEAEKDTGNAALAQIASCRHRLGCSLFGLIDGPGRCLAQRLESSKAADEELELILRVRSTAGQPIAELPAGAWRWELLHDGKGPLALDPKLSIAVQLGLREPQRSELGHGQLRILFMAYAPSLGEEHVLDYEAEEELILAALADARRDGRVLVEVVEDGTLAELERRLKAGAYDAVHLSGHGGFRDGRPVLLLEDEVGDPDPVDAAALWRVLERSHRGRVPPLVVVSSCHSAGKPQAGASLAARLVASGAPAVVGWMRPVQDDLATLAARDLYERLAAGVPLPRAVAFARRQLAAADARLPQPTLTWATLHLLGRDGSGFRLDTGVAPPKERARPAETYRYLGEQGQMRVLERGFVGRRRELQRLVRILRDGRDGEQPVAGAALLGMKGVGKSCLAARALDRHQQDAPELEVAVLHGRLREAELLDPFLVVARRWEDPDAEAVLTDAATREPERRIERLLQGAWRDRDLVIVLDDFEHNLERPPEGHFRLEPLAARLLTAWLPACRTNRCKLLVTCTASFVLPPPHGGTLSEIELGPFGPASVRKLWYRGQGEAGDLHHLPLGDWQRLSGRLGRNARILDWTRALLGGGTREEMLELVEEAEARLDWKGRSPSEEEQARLAGLFLRHLAHERAREEVGPDAVTLVERARVYELPVPARAFAGLLGEDLDLDLERALPALANRGLLELGRLGSERAYRVSPLVEPELRAPEPERWHRVAAEFWRGAARHDQGWATAFVIQAWEHALAGQDQEVGDWAAELLGPFLDAQGLYGQSRELGLRNLEVFPESEAGLRWTGVAEHKVGRLEGAEVHLQKATQMAESRHAEPERTAELLWLLGRVQHARGRLTEAGATLERATGLLPSSPASMTLASCVQELAVVLRAQGDLSGARRELERSLEIQKRVLGTEEHPSFAASLHALAEVLRAQGDLSGARRELERSLEITKRVLGTEEHPDFASSLHELAGVLRAQGDLSGARRELERSLEIKKRVLGTEEHPSFASSLHALAVVLQAQGDLSGARRELERSLEIQKRVLGTEEHPSFAASLHELAVVLQAQGDLSGARRELERSLEIQKRVLGTEEHPDFAASLHELAVVLQAQGDLSGARRELERSLEIQKRVLGTEEHPDFAASLHALAGLEEAGENLDEAARLYRRVLEVEEPVYGTRDHYSIAETEWALARVLARLGEEDEARPLAQHAIAVLQKQVPNHPILQGLAKAASEGSDLPAPGDLAKRALEARSSRAGLATELETGLDALAAGGPPHDAVAAHLRALAEGGEIPPLPESLPEGVRDFLEQVDRAARSAVSYVDLARRAFELRHSGESRDASLEHGLRVLEEAGPPHAVIAEHLRAVAAGEEPPEIPEEVEGEQRALLEQVHAAVSSEVSSTDLARRALAVRASGEEDPELRRGLDVLESAGPPHSLVAAYLHEVAAGNEREPIPDQLDGDARALLEAVDQALEAAEPVPQEETTTP